MVKKLGLAALAFVLLAGVAAAFEMQRHPSTGEEVQPPFGPVPGGGEIVIYNYDWVPYYIEIQPHSFVMRIRKEGDIRQTGSPMIPPGARLRIPSPRHIWSLEGNNGRSLSVGVHHDRAVEVELVPDGGNGMIGLEAIVRDRLHQDTELLIAWEERHESRWPQPPPPTPYQPPMPMPEPIPVIGYDPPPSGYPVPVIGQDPPSYPYPVPVIDHNPPPYQPYHYEPPIQIPSPHRYEPPIPQIPPQHYNPNIFRR